MQGFENFIGLNPWTALFTLCNLVIVFLMLKKFLFKPGKDDEEEDLDAIIVQAQPRSEPAASEREESDDDSDSGAAEVAPARKDSGKLPKGKKAGEKDGKSRRSGDDPEKGV